MKFHSLKRGLVVGEERQRRKEEERGRRYGKNGSTDTPQVMLRRFGSTLTNSSVKTFGKKAAAGARKRRSLEDSVSFEDFVLRGQVLHVYRDMLRNIYKIPDTGLRSEVLAFVKGEFAATKDVTDINVKRSLLIGGIRQWKSVSNNMGLSYTEIQF